MSESGKLEITTLCLDDEVAEGRLPVPTFIKVDVEGAEAEVLEGARRIVAEHHPTLLVSTHGEEPHKAVERFLSEQGYTTERVDPNDLPFHAELLATPRA